MARVTGRIETTSFVSVVLRNCQISKASPSTPAVATPSAISELDSTLARLRAQQGQHQYYKPPALLCVFSLADANMVIPVSWVACWKTAWRAISGHVTY